MAVKLAQATPGDIARPPVSVKGTKEGLLFVFDEHCSFELLETHLEEIFHGEKSNLWSGPEIAISVDYGSRKLTPVETNALIARFLAQENFLIREWGPKTSARQALFANRKSLVAQTIHKGTVRAGQRLLFDGDVVVIGDVNPGGEIVATGDIYVFGRLRGTAHAGAAGDPHAVIGAAEFEPMQLRIADIVSRAPEVEGRAIHTFMEFAYLHEEAMAVDKLQYLASIRPHVGG